MSDDATHAFMETTGVNDPATAARALAAANGDLDAAVARHFDEEAAAGADDGTEAAEEAAAPPSLPMPESDLVGSILSNARQEGSEQGSEWSRPGRTLGGADSDAASTASAPVEPTRRNAKKVRVLFWADGFTVEDITAEEEAAAAAAAAERAAPRRTGVATLGDSRRAAAAAAGPPPELPELRRYEENKEFMEHLKRGVPPVELREFDLSSGAPLPRPVDIALGDMRPAPFPAEAARRMARAPEAVAAAPPRIVAFSGEGRALGAAAPAAEDGAAAAAAAAAAVSEGSPLVVVEDSPTTTLQVRLADGSRTTVRANKSHTLEALHAHIASLTPGVAFSLRAGVPPPPLARTGCVDSASSRHPLPWIGFPPKRLGELGRTLEEAGLLNEAITQSKE